MNITRLSFLISAAISCISLSAELPAFEIVDTNVPKSSYGTITRMDVKSENLNDKVTIDIWTPADYDATAEKRYPVLYAHDGQNLFDGNFSFIGVPWAVDKICCQLADDPDFVMPIVVGISNRGMVRPNDYFPENALEYISPEDVENTLAYQSMNNTFYGNAHAAFVATELKPLIDSLYATAPSMPTTFVMGSSMGGLSSMYLLCEYPEVFAGAACLSTHWIGSLSYNPDWSVNDDEVCANAILQYLDTHLPKDNQHKIYMDQGTEGLDALYLRYEDQAREIARNNGYTEENGRLKVYDADGAGHNEIFWQARLHIPLSFILTKEAPGNSGIDDLLPAPTITPCDNSIYDISGRKYRSEDLNYLPAGIYIQYGKKIIKR